MDKRIRILICDDHLLFRMGLKSLLGREPAMRVVGEAATGSQTIEQCKLLRPDVIVLDLRMPEGGGIGALRSLCKQCPESRVLILSSYASEEEVYQALDAGALGYMLKDTGRDTLLHAIEEVHCGRRCVPEWVESILLERRYRPDLTSREMQVLDLLVTGLTNREIGRVLGNSENTIRNHTISIFAKLEVSDRAEAVSAALQRGIVVRHEAPQNPFR
jgi:DNA-binding NarL/FixJ family response regulator